MNKKNAAPLHNMSRLVIATMLALVMLVVVSCTPDEAVERERETRSDVGVGLGGDWAARGARAAGEPAELPSFSAGILNVLGSAESAQRCSFALTDALDFLGADHNEFDSQGDPAQMAEGMEVLLDEGHDVIFGLSVEPAAIAVQLQRAEEEGIPFINYCGTVRKDETVAASPVPSDYAQAALAGQYIIDALIEKNPRNPRGQIAVLEFPQLLSLFQRVHTVEVMFEEWEGIEIVARHEVDFARADQDIRGAVLDMVTANPDLDFVYALGDFMLPPTTSALQEAGVTGEVRVVSAQSGSPSVLELVEQGRVEAVVDPRLDASAYIAADLVANALARDEEINDFEWHRYEHFFGYSIVTEHNVDPTYEMRPGYVVQEPVADFVSFFESKWAEEFGVGD